jgi:tRNA (guanine37-N1)-methyltransferase
MKKIPQDIIGNIAILKFGRKTPWIVRKFLAWRFLRTHKNVTTVLDKIGGFSGSLRIQKTAHLAGIKTKEAVYTENGCRFFLNVNETYFSPRLSNERNIVGEKIANILKKRGGRVLVVFAGVAPYSIVIGKKLKKAGKSACIISNELNGVANEYAKKNIRVNKLSDTITLVPGDAKNLVRKIKKPFDVILMTRPNLEKTFLDTALKLSKKGTIIFYHGFGKRKDVLSEIKRDAGKSIGKIEIRKAGNIGPYEYRWQARFRVS